MFKLYIGCNHSLKAQLGHSKQISCFSSIALISKLEVGAGPVILLMTSQIPFTSAMRPRFQGKCMTDMLLSVMIYDLCCSKTQPWTIFELGDDRMSFRELIIASWWAFYFNEVPVKVQISCNLEPCCLKKLIIKSARLHAWGSHSHAGRWNRKFIWSDLKSMSKHIHTLNKVIKNYIEQGKKVKKQLRMYMKVQSFDIDLI